jgi:ketosteroid isomerase-like protein
MILPLAFLVAVACQPAAAPLTDEDVAAIRTLGASYTQALLAGDADGVAAQWVDAGIEMPPNVPAAAEKAAIRARYAEAFQLGLEMQSFTITPVEIDGMDGLAFERGTYTWSGILPGESEPTTDSGKYLGISRRQQDGSWLWTATIWNSDLPLPQPQ